MQEQYSLIVEAGKAGKFTNMALNDLPQLLLYQFIDENGLEDGIVPVTLTNTAIIPDPIVTKAKLKPGSMVEVYPCYALQDGGTVNFEWLTASVRQDQLSEQSVGLFELLP